MSWLSRGTRHLHDARTIGALALASLLVGTDALALPQFAIRSSRTCNNCHVEPFEFENPSIELRKCSLNCGTCHVNPSGGGMRGGSGRYYGREEVPLFGSRPSEWVAESVLTSSAGPASGPSSGPTTFEAARSGAHIPGHRARYAGLEPFPIVQLGADLRLMGYFPEGGTNAFFPMQTDLHLAVRPYNPEQLNEGRVTVLATLGFEGRRANEFSGFADRFFVKEYWALAHDLPYQLYGKLGRFLPAYGWRLDDHTPFIRQGQGFDNEAQVTGLEVGLNPNYLFGHLSIFNPALEWDKPIESDRGIGVAASGGYRELLWQLGGQFMAQARKDATELWAGAHWGLNFHEATHDWKGLELAPVIYLGELDVQTRTPEGGDAVTALSAFHEVDVEAHRGINLKLRYDWRDANLSNLDDHRHRLTFGFEIHPYTFVEVIAQYRLNLEPGSRDDNEGILQVHGWF
ncbi:MAG: hypothetical protein HY791_40095 [Deltaproteobacteria bacterium]|nr:hypothetical protein [Deltaproteobacteria bacterium]